MPVVADFWPTEPRHAKRDPPFLLANTMRGQGCEESDRIILDGALRQQISPAHSPSIYVAVRWAKLFPMRQLGSGQAFSGRQTGHFARVIERRRGGVRVRAAFEQPLVIASEAKQSRVGYAALDCFASLAMTIQGNVIMPNVMERKFA